MNEEKNQTPILEDLDSPMPEESDKKELNLVPEAEEPVLQQEPEVTEAEKIPATPETPIAPETPAVAPEEPVVVPEEPKVVYRWDYSAQKRYDDEVRRKKTGRRSRLAFAGIVSCAFLIVIGLLIGVLAFRDYFAPNRQKMDTVAVAEKLLPATVLISATKGSEGSVGSGFFIRQDGIIATNYHVVEGADTLKVKLYGSKEKKEAFLLGYNVACDIAVLKIDGSGYPTVTFGDSDALCVGEEVVAVGNPAGTDAEWTVTKGIVSSTDRKVLVSGDKEYLELKMIQTDAAVNPGNSGGILCNGRGEVVGIVARKQVYRALDFGSGSTLTVFEEGIGYAIPGNGAKKIIDGIIGLRKVDPVAAGLMRARPLIGISVMSIKAGEKLVDEQIIAAPQDGVLVTTVGANAANGLLEVGDIIITFDGIRVTESDELIEMLYSYKQGDRVKVKVIKNGEYSPIEIEMTLGVFAS